ncbi:Blp family class II bacteriocin [Streptococcus jiangjianxini]|uniref:Blp family class II bacteriocin n=1 Tax=Streptococcus jiangjianxini TaxID=3161189 RepID=UPI0032EDD404
MSEEFLTIDEAALEVIAGGNKAGDVVISATGCAATGIKYGKSFGVWGAVICGGLTYAAN